MHQAGPVKNDKSAKMAGFRLTVLPRFIIKGFILLPENKGISAFVA